MAGRHGLRADGRSEQVSQFDALECREQAKYCRELAMSTSDFRTERSLLQAASEMEQEACEMDATLRAPQG